MGLLKPRARARFGSTGNVCQGEFQIGSHSWGCQGKSPPTEHIFVELANRKLVAEWYLAVCQSQRLIVGTPLNNVEQHICRGPIFGVEAYPSLQRASDPSSNKHGSALSGLSIGD